MKMRIKKLILLILAFSFVTSSIYAQNLIKNPGFEEYINCPENNFSFSFPPNHPEHEPSNYILDWYRIMEDNPDVSNVYVNYKPQYFNACDSNGILCITDRDSFPRYGVPNNYVRNLYTDSGNAYLGMTLWSRKTVLGGMDAIIDNLLKFRKDFIATDLKNELVPGEYYNLSFYIIQGEDTRFCNSIELSHAIDKIGIFFSDTFHYSASLSDLLYPNIQPQLESPDSLYFKTEYQQWVKVNFNFFATHDYKIMTVGNFHSYLEYENKINYNKEGENKAYYFFDNFNLRKYNDDIFEAINPTKRLGVCYYDTIYSGFFEPDGQLWSTGDTTPYITYPSLDFVDDTAVVWVKTVQNGLLYIDTFLIYNNTFNELLDFDTTICISEDLELNLSMFGANKVWYNDSFGKYMFPPTLDKIEGKYLYYYKLKDTCSEEYGKLYLNLINPPNLNLPDTIFKCIGDIAKLTIEDSVGTIMWSNGNTSSTIFTQSQGLYIVSSLSECGMIYDSTYVEFKKCEFCVAVPTAFSPNNDGLNDVFRVVNRCPEINKFYIQIYDRWGNLVFKSYNNEFEWDGTFNGKKCESGVYFYILSYEGMISNELIQQKGDITLIR